MKLSEKVKVSPHQVRQGKVLDFMCTKKQLQIHHISVKLLHVIRFVSYK